MNEAELRRLFETRPRKDSYEDYMDRFCRFKHNSDFSREMTRSVGVYLEDFLHK